MLSEREKGNPSEMYCCHDRYIINISSVAGLHAIKGQAPYCARYSIHVYSSPDEELPRLLSASKE